MSALMKSTYLGLILNTLLPAAILIFAYIRSGQTMTGGAGFDLQLTESISPVFYALLIVALSEILAIYLIRTKLPSRIYGSNTGSEPERFVATVYKTSLFMFLCTASISLYGLVMMVLGGSFEVTVLFVALTYLSYQIFRPRKAYLEKLYDRLIPENDAASCQ